MVEGFVVITLNGHKGVDMWFKVIGMIAEPSGQPDSDG